MQYKLKRKAVEGLTANISVWDKGAGGLSTFLGEVDVPLYAVDLDSATSSEYTLRDPVRKHGGGVCPHYANCTKDKQHLSLYTIMICYGVISVPFSMTLLSLYSGGIWCETHVLTICLAHICLYVCVSQDLVKQFEEDLPELVIGVRTVLVEQSGKKKNKAKYNVEVKVVSASGLRVTGKTHTINPFVKW